MSESRRENPAAEPTESVTPPADPAGEYTPEEEDEVRKRLEDLGYVE